MAGPDQSRTLLTPERAKQLAADIRSRHPIDPRFALPMERVAEGEGVRVTYHRMLLEGALSRTDDGHIIRVRIDSTPNRRRFTVAHELGHLVVERLGLAKLPARTEFHRTQSHNAEERFCDAFAAYLLVPGEAIADICNWGTLTIPKLLERSSNIGASVETLAWRLVEELPGDGGVLWFRYMGKPNDVNNRRLRLDWGVFPHRKQVFLPKYAAVDSGSALQSAFASQAFQSITDFPLRFGSLREARSLLVKALGARLMALVKPQDVL